jgi:sugar phosphate permease
MYFITYVDRVNISTAASVIKSEFSITNTNFGYVFSAFAIPYLVIQFFGGVIADHFGPRRTLFACALIWAAATILTGFATGFAFLFACRLLVGIGEGASFATASRAIQAWMPNLRRGFAQGLTHACARLGNFITPPLVVWLIHMFSWRGAFAIDGLFSLSWGIVWYLYYRDDPHGHPAIAAEDIAKLPARHPPKRAAEIPWLPLFGRLLPVTLTYFCYGYTLWLLLSWLPQYFQNQFGLNLKDSAIFSSAVYLAGVVGDGFGGFLSDWLLKRTGNLTLSRLGVICFSFLGAAASLIAAVQLHGLTPITMTLASGFFFLELAIGAFWALPGDIAPKFSGTAAGLMNVGSALAAVVSPPMFGFIVDSTGKWSYPFYGSIGLLLAGMALAFAIRPHRQFERD